MSAWFVPARPNPSARVRLICFAHAGGGASGFARWPLFLPGEIEVVGCHLPGREARFREAPIERMEPLLDAITPELQPLLDRPYALLGHSLGSWVAFGAARRLRALGAPAPVRLFVSGCRAPHLSSRFPPIHQLPASAMVHEIQRRYGVLPALILEDREVLEMFTRVLRSDLALFETTRFPPDEPLACPISAYGGREDVIVSAPDLEAWAEHSAAGDFEFRSFPGGHHYIRDLPEGLLPGVAAALGSPAEGR
ncbi:MAG: alpha/beta fold hydrolase [Acidobacteria bacterium]|nr:alpha/beta fold hydrolase [Acidobacteriota bacterium]